MNFQTMGSSPVTSDPSSLNAPVERSRQLSLMQVGQASLTVAITVFPLAVFVISTCFPQ